MGNVLSETKRQQVIALGRLGWSLRRIEQETGVRRETAGGYLKAAGRLEKRARAKTGHASDHRLQHRNPVLFKTGHGGDHRPRVANSVR